MANQWEDTWAHDGPLQDIHRGDLGRTSTGKVHDPTAWGGYSGTNVKTPGGAVLEDRNLSGQTADVGRYRTLGEVAANQPAYQNNYDQANRYRAMGMVDRTGQMRGLGYMAAAASGQTPTQAQMLGRRMLGESVAAQQSGAASMRGGSLAQAAAMRRQQQGQAGFEQQGRAQIAAAHADELQTARQQYAQAALQMGGLDLQSQKLAQDQANAQMANELQQRQLNQRGQLGYEGMAYDVNAAALQAALQKEQAKAGMYQNQLAIDQSQREREARIMGATTAAVGSGASHLLDTKSDYRSKERIVSLSETAVKSKRGAL